MTIGNFDYVRLKMLYVSQNTWNLAKPGNRRQPTESPALFIPSAPIGSLKAFKYATVYLCCHFKGVWLLAQFAGRAAVRGYPSGSTMMFDARLIMNSMVRPTTTEVSSAFTRISVQALTARKSCDNSWITARIFMIIGIRMKTEVERNASVSKTK